MGTIKYKEQKQLKRNIRIATYMWKKENKSQNDQKEVKPVPAQDLKSDLTSSNSNDQSLSF